MLLRFGRVPYTRAPTVHRALTVQLLVTLQVCQIALRQAYRVIMSTPGIVPNEYIHRSTVEEDALRERRPVLLVGRLRLQANPKEAIILLGRLLERLHEVGILSPNDLLFYGVSFAFMNAEVADVRKRLALERRHPHELLHIDDDVQPDMPRRGE